MSGQEKHCSSHWNAPRWRPVHERPRDLAIVPQRPVDRKSFPYRCEAYVQMVTVFETPVVGVSARVTDVRVQWRFRLPRNLVIRGVIVLGSIWTWTPALNEDSKLNEPLFGYFDPQPTSHKLWNSVDVRLTSPIHRLHLTHCERQPWFRRGSENLYQCFCFQK